jgi:hypothetical protein
MPGKVRCRHLSTVAACRWSLAAAAVLAFATVTSAEAACGFGRPTVSYQAKKTIQQGKVTASATVYATKDMERHEPKGMTEVVIYRFDKNIEWMLLPEFKRFSELAMEVDPEKFMESKVVGKEMLNGVPVTKCHYKAVYPDGGAEEGDMWITNDAVVLKRHGKLSDAQGELDYTETLTEFKLKQHDPSLFRIPSDYDPHPIAITGLSAN